MTNLEISLSAVDADRLMIVADHYDLSPNSLIRFSIEEFCNATEDLKTQGTLSGDVIDAESDDTMDVETTETAAIIDPCTKAASYVVDVPAWQTVTLMESTVPVDALPDATVEEKAQRVVRDMLKLFVEKIPELNQPADA